MMRPHPAIGALLCDTGAPPLTLRAVQSLLRSAETTMGAGTLPSLTVVAVHPNYWSHPTTGALLMSVASWRGAATSGHDDNLWTPTLLGNVLLVPQGTAQCAAYLAQRSFEPSPTHCQTVVFIDVGDRFSTARADVQCIGGEEHLRSVQHGEYCGRVLPSPMTQRCGTSHDWPCRRLSTVWRPPCRL